jgi:hypothetical protein
VEACTSCHREGPICCDSEKTRARWCAKCCRCDCHKAEKCQRCGRRHVARWVWLELSQDTGQYHKPGEVPAGETSQGLFRFGAACARTQLLEGRR